MSVDYSQFCYDCGQVLSVCSCLPMETVGRSAFHRALESELDEVPGLLKLHHGTPPPSSLVREMVPIDPLPLLWGPHIVVTEILQCPDCGHQGLPCPGPHGAD